jgi:ATP:corrinoid adenosyltransferase
MATFICTPVTEMAEIKHYCNKGIEALKGIEF